MLKVIAFMFLLCAQFILARNGLNFLNPEWWLLIACIAAYNVFEEIDNYV